MLAERKRRLAERAHAMGLDLVRRKRRRVQRAWEELQREGEEADAAVEAAFARKEAECVAAMAAVERQRAVAAAQRRRQRQQQIQQYEARVAALLSLQADPSSLFAAPGATTDATDGVEAPGGCTFLPGPANAPSASAADAGALLGTLSMQQMQSDDPAAAVTAQRPL